MSPQILEQRLHNPYNNWIRALEILGKSIRPGDKSYFNPGHEEIAVNGTRENILPEEIEELKNLGFEWDDEWEAFLTTELI